VQVDDRTEGSGERGKRLTGGRRSARRARASCTYHTSAPALPHSSTSWARHRTPSPSPHRPSQTVLALSGRRRHLRSLQTPDRCLLMPSSPERRLSRKYTIPTQRSRPRASVFGVLRCWGVGPIRPRGPGSGGGLTPNSDGIHRSLRVSAPRSSSCRVSSPPKHLACAVPLTHAHQRLTVPHAARLPAATQGARRPEAPRSASRGTPPALCGHPGCRHLLGLGGRHLRGLPQRGTSTAARPSPSRVSPRDPQRRGD